MTSKKPSFFRIPFVIHKQPFCFWDYDIATTNRRFIDRIDPQYFEFVGEVYSQLLKSDLGEKQKQYAAVAMRMAYSQGLEVLFSLLFASLQAPNCVVGWLSKYQLKHLRDLIDGIRNYRPMLSRFQNEFREWRDIVTAIFGSLGSEAIEANKGILDGFASLWANFAQDFTEQTFTDEYNSIKHGLRVHIGGFHLMMGPQTEYGVATKIEDMETVSYSPFGTTFFSTEKIGKTPNYIVHETSRNWNPENHVKALKLISVSIQNILVFLDHSTGKIGPHMQILPNDENFYIDPWRIGSGGTMGHNSQIRIDAIPLMSAKEILSSYTDEK